MDLSRLSTATKVITGAAILYLILLTIIDWQQVCFASICGGVSGWHGSVGVILGLLLIVLIAWEAMKIFGVDLPELPVTTRQIELVVIGGVVVFTILKFISANEARVWWVQIVGLILAGVIGWFGWQRMNEPDAAPAAASPAPAAPTYTPPAPAAPAAPAEPAAPAAPAADEPADDPPSSNTY